MRALLVVSTMVVVFALAGCTGQASPSRPAVETTQVTMAKSYRFDPFVIQVKAGSTVTWTNEDNFTHDVHLLGSADWKSQPLRPGEKASYTFNQPGEYPFECDFHPQNMSGKVIVVAS